MKKLFFIAALFTATLTQAQSQIKWPFGAASAPTVSVTSKSTAQTFTVSNNLTYIDLGTIDTNKTIVCTIGAANVNGGTNKPDIGAKLYVRITSDATARVITSSTGLTSSTYTLTASKAHLLTYVYDGTNFIGEAQLKITN